MRSVVETVRTGRWAELIEGARKELIERWTKWVIDDPAIPEANRLPHPQLVDHMPQLVDAIVAELEALEVGESGAERLRRAQQALDSATGHGRMRALAGYDLRAAMRELGLFRAVIIDLCDERGLPLSGDAAIATHRVIDSAFAEAATVMQEAYSADIATERDQAHEANAKKDEFLSFLSHEVRNVLNVILGWSHAAEGQGEAVARRALVVVHRNAELLQRLVGDILELRRAETGKLRLEVRPLDPCDVLRKAVESARARAAAKPLVLVLGACPADVVVMGDADRLTQVLGNLLDNAIKFTPANGRVEAWAEASDSTVRIAIRDTGPGIAQERLELVFDPYRQGSEEDRPSDEGLGLGLAIVRELVERHGGTVHCESPGLGQGATFWVTLPRQAP